MKKHIMTLVLWGGALCGFSKEYQLTVLIDATGFNDKCYQAVYQTVGTEWPNQIYELGTSRVRIHAHLFGIERYTLKANELRFIPLSTAGKVVKNHDVRPSGFAADSPVNTSNEALKNDFINEMRNWLRNSDGVILLSLNQNLTNLKSSTLEELRSKLSIINLSKQGNADSSLDSGFAKVLEGAHSKFRDEFTENQRRLAKEQTDHEQREKSLAAREKELDNLTSLAKRSGLTQTGDLEKYKPDAHTTAFSNLLDSLRKPVTGEGAGDVALKATLGQREKELDNLTSLAKRSGLTQTGALEKYEPNAHTTAFSNLLESRKPTPGEGTGDAVLKTTLDQRTKELNSLTSLAKLYKYAPTETLEKYEPNAHTTAFSTLLSNGKKDLDTVTTEKKTLQGQLTETEKKLKAAEQKIRDLPKPDPTPTPTPKPTPVPQPEPVKPDDGGGRGLLVFVILLALAGGGVWAWKVFTKPKLKFAFEESGVGGKELKGVVGNDGRSVLNQNQLLKGVSIVFAKDAKGNVGFKLKVRPGDEIRYGYGNTTPVVVPKEGSPLLTLSTRIALYVGKATASVGYLEVRRNA